jgi:hypothetical protein
MFHLNADGKRTSVRTRLSHGERRVDDWIQSQIARELHLSKRELWRFVKCEIGEQENLDMMIDAGCVLP